jgi:hypothetical protein
LKIQIFDPFADIWPHAYPMAKVAEAFTSKAHEVEIVRCNGLFASHCVAMSASSTSFNDSSIQKRLVCKSCKKRSQIITDASSSSEVIFDQFVESEDRIQAIALADAIDPKDWINIKIRDIPVGAISTYELLLAHKLNSRTIPESLWPEYRANLINTILVVSVAEKILEVTRPHRVLVYNELYSLNNAYVHVAKAMGIQTFSLQGGPHIARKASTLTAFTSAKTMFESTYSKEVSDWLSAPLDKESIEIVSEHLTALLSGESAFVYSTKADGKKLDQVSEKLRLTSEKKTLLVLLTSEDEFFAADLVDAIPSISSWKGIFKDQLAWLSWLIKFAERHNELNVVVRVHPRMLPNKRERITSPYIREVTDLLSDPPPNVRINVPSDEISLYDLMQFTDLVLNKRSSAGLELLAYGIPVVLPGDKFLFSCHPSLCMVGSDEESYEELIVKGLNEGWSLERIRMAYRWLGFVMRSTTVEVFPNNSSRLGKMRPKRSELLIKLWKKLAFFYLHMGPMMAEKKNATSLEENLANLDYLVETVTLNLPGIYSCNTRSKFDESTLEEETQNLVKDLRSRLALLVDEGGSSSPLVSQIRVAIGQ